MSIELLVLPLSRYLSGDYISPAMRAAWDLGSDYVRVSPNEPPLRIPAGQVLGGAAAAARRAEILPMVVDMQRNVTGRVDAWDERVGGDTPGFILDPVAFEALSRDALATERTSIFKALMRTAQASHLGRGQFFLPHPFRHVLDQGGWMLASLPRARQELQDVMWSADALPAVTVLTEAISLACKVRLPLVLDW